MHGVRVQPRSVHCDTTVRVGLTVPINSGDATRALDVDPERASALVMVLVVQEAMRDLSKGMSDKCQTRSIVTRAHVARQTVWSASTVFSSVVN